MRKTRKKAALVLLALLTAAQLNGCGGKEQKPQLRERHLYRRRLTGMKQDQGWRRLQLTVELEPRERKRPRQMDRLQEKVRL